MTQHRTRELWYLVPFYNAEINYSYVVNGEYYSGFFARTFFRERYAHKFLDELKGKEVDVRYKADSPNVSAIVR